MERIQTLSEIPFQVDFHQVVKQSLYQEIVVTALHSNSTEFLTSGVTAVQQIVTTEFFA